MIINLIRKDMILIRKYIYIMIACAIIAPSLLYKNAKVSAEMQGYMGITIFFIVLFITVLFLSNSVSMAEEKYKKGCIYLCTTPYTRTQMVISRYLFTYIIFGAYCLLYEATHLLFSEYTIKLTTEVILCSLLCISLFRGILIPLEYRYGYEKAKYIITFLIIGVPFVASYVVSNMGKNLMDLASVSISENMLVMITTVVIVVVNFISIVCSCYIFNNKEF